MNFFSWKNDKNGYEAGNTSMHESMIQGMQMYGDNSGNADLPGFAAKFPEKESVFFLIIRSLCFSLGC